MFRTTPQLLCFVFIVGCAGIRSPDHSVSGMTSHPECAQADKGPSLAASLGAGALIGTALSILTGAGIGVLDGARIGASQGLAARAGDTARLRHACPAQSIGAR